MCVCVYMRPGAAGRVCQQRNMDGGRTRLRGWRNTVELVLFEISISMKPFPSVCHAYTSKLRPMIGLCLSQNISVRFPTVFQPLIDGTAEVKDPWQCFDLALHGIPDVQVCLCLPTSY